jgi:integrase
VAQFANPALSRNTLKRVQSALSGIFSLAKRLGYYDVSNPCTGTRTDPKATESSETVAYSLEDEERILSVLPESAATIFAVAAYAGLRQGEMQGLTWPDYANGELRVAHSIWNGRVGLPKTRKSMASVPVIRQLRERLDMHRSREASAFASGKRTAPPIEGPIFSTAIGTPLGLPNLVKRYIQPALNRCVHCGRSPGIPHLPATHGDFERDERFP